MELAKRFYQTSTRKELGQVIRCYAHSIPPELLKDLTIAINGSMNNGKSYFWHEFQHATMEQNATLMRSEDKMGDIAFKTWAGKHIETQQPIHLHTENVNITGRFKNTSNPTIDSKAFGEDNAVILMSNLEDQHTSKVDVLVTLTTIGFPHHNNWDRFMNIDTFNTALLNSPRYNQELRAA